MIEKQLELLAQEFTTLKEKVKNKLAQNQQALNEKTTQLQEANRKLELTLKENSENEAVLEQLLKEFKELEAELN